MRILLSQVSLFERRKADSNCFKTKKLQVKQKSKRDIELHASIATTTTKKRMLSKKIQHLCMFFLLFLIQNKMISKLNTKRK